MKITTYEICDTVNRRHLNGQIIFYESSNGKGFASFIVNGVMETLEMGNNTPWVCENRALGVIWTFIHDHYQHVTHTRHNNGRQYNHYIKYEVVGPLPEPGSGTAGNTGGN